MNQLKYKLFLFTIISIFFLNISVVYSSEKIPTNIIIQTANLPDYNLNYNSNPIKARKIITNIGTGYSLEYTKNYPKCQNFSLQEIPSETIQKILYNGFPNKSSLDLNLISDDDAYFATQVAIWCAVEKYDINKINGSTTRLYNAITNIYNKSMNATNISDKVECKTYCTPGNITNVVMIPK